MSWYIYFRAAARDKTTNMIYPLGPYDYKGRYFPLLEVSRESHIYENNSWKMSEVNYEDLSEEFKKAVDPEGEWLTKEEYGKYSNRYEVMKYEDLRSCDFIKKGYVLIEDLERAEDEDSYFDGFYDVLTPEIYAKKLENELKFGPPKPQKDCEGYEITPHSVSEYTYHCWPDYDTEEYETFCIKNTMNILLSGYPSLPENLEAVLMIDQG